MYKINSSFFKYPFYTTEKYLNAYRHFRYGGLQNAKRYLAEFEHNHVHILSVTPPIVYMWWGTNDLALHQELSSTKLTVLYLFPWCFNPSEIPKISAYLRNVNYLYPTHSIIFLCNEKFAVEELKLANIRAEFIHQNAFINENTFRPNPEIRPTHDAVYSASIASYKRHYLAEKVNSLIMLSYTYLGNSDTAYGEDIRRRLRHAWWAKDSLTKDQMFPVQKMVDLYAQAHIGLCLSAVEGGMFASMEYLLCGLPIVSTKSIGGRDVFWDDRYVIVCEDSVEAVSESVEKLKSQNISRDDVRRWTLDKIDEHRQRLRVLMHLLGAELHCPWPPGTNGCTSFANIRQLGKNINRENIGVKFAKN